MKKIKYAALLDAVQTGKTSIVHRALKQGRNPNYSKNNDGYTLLQWAVQCDHADMVKLLVKHGADIQTSHYGSTPLTNAAGDGNLEMVELLVALGADVNYTTKSGTPLIMASTYNQEAIVRFLLKSGANVNGPDKCGQTPLFSAARQGHLATINVLLEAGADKAWQDRKHCRAADIARKSAKKARKERKKSIALADAIAARLN